MRMKFRALVILLLSLVILSCSRSGPVPEPAAVPPVAPADKKEVRAAAVAPPRAAEGENIAPAPPPPPPPKGEEREAVWREAATSPPPAETAYVPPAVTPPSRPTVAPAPPSAGTNGAPPPSAAAEKLTGEGATPAKELFAGKIAWNTPPAMQMGESAAVELRVTLDPELFAGLATRVLAEGVTTSEEVELSKDLSATLISTGFDIKPEGPQKQHVFKGRDAIWLWGITPKFPGDHTLILTIGNVLEEGVNNKPLIRKIFVKAMPEPPLGVRAMDFILRNWDKLLVLVLIPIGGWIVKKYRK